jgi:putative hydrolase
VAKESHAEHIPAVNRNIAARLTEAADLLEQQDANPFRVTAYRGSAETLANLHDSVAELAASAGAEGLTELPGIGRGIAAAILEMVHHGRWSFLDRLRGSFDPIQIFQTIPGIGPVLAEQIHDTLDVDTLEVLEVAAHDGSLELVDGIGPARAAMIRSSLESMLGSAHRPKRSVLQAKPPVDVILDVDREYLEKAAAGSLRTIAPRRFNPRNEAWLPVLHAERGPWSFTALFSNSARAHTLNRTRDWVVIYHYYDDDNLEGQHTVVTERRGPLSSKRVVRGREVECVRHYAQRDES